MWAFLFHFWPTQCIPNVAQIDSSSFWATCIYTHECIYKYIVNANKNTRCTQHLHANVDIGQCCSNMHLEPKWSLWPKICVDVGVLEPWRIETPKGWNPEKLEPWKRNSVNFHHLRMKSAFCIEKKVQHMIFPSLLTKFTKGCIDFDPSNHKSTTFRKKCPITCKRCSLAGKHSIILLIVMRFARSDNLPHSQKKHLTQLYIII